MKRLVFFTFFMMLFTFSVAQDKKFSPEKFEADLAEYITKEAKLSDEEASKYFLCCARCTRSSVASSRKSAI